MTDNGGGWPSPPQNTLSANVGTSPLAVNGEILTDPTPKASARLRLSSLADVKRQLRLIFIEARNREIATSEATRLTYILTQLATLIADADLEARISAIELDRK